MATKVGEKYQCRECGLVVEVIEAGAGMLYCCDEIMRVEKPKTSADFMQAFGGDFKGRTLQ
ncbi:MAG: desulfoferrodoxin FeS4 iron-binding domain-containing protein [Bacillota bacterium]|jgi:desulfoferrodoxin-like iron-binding protein